MCYRFFLLHLLHNCYISQNFFFALLINISLSFFQMPTPRTFNCLSCVTRCGGKGARKLTMYKVVAKTKNGVRRHYYQGCCPKCHNKVSKPAKSSTSSSSSSSTGKVKPKKSVSSIRKKTTKSTKKRTVPKKQHRSITRRC